MDHVVDEAIGSVHLTPRGSIRAEKGILALEGCTPPRIPNVSMNTCRQLTGLQSCQPSQFSRVNFASDVCRHVHRRFFRLGHIVLGYRQTTRLDGDLDVAVHSLAGYGRGAEARVDGGCFATALVFDTVVL
jgi:hypothetical protein